MARTAAPFSGTGAGIAITTLRLSKCFHNPDTAEWIVLGAMIALPVIIRLFRGKGMGDENRDVI